MSLLSHLYTHPPRYGPEWGSGGIFGLKYYRGVLYYTLAFEAEVYFIDHGGLRLLYRFEKVGLQPASGGDTYNAVEVVDNRIFFGGWVHAPARYRGKTRYGSTIDFSNKYSHVHYYDIDNNSVELLWRESMHDPERWVGEVSEIVYNPYSDELLIARADGHENLGVYSISPRSRKVERVLEKPALKGAQHLDQACFAIHTYPQGFRGIECIDVVTGEKLVKEFTPLAIDGDAVLNPQVGPVTSAYGWLLTFVKGGVILSDVFEDQHHLVRLLDIPYLQLGPTRTKLVHLGGGVLIPYNTYTHGVVRASGEEVEAKRYLSAIASPTLLLYIAPPAVKIAAALGARVTSLEVVGDKVLLATNTMANTGRYDASPFDQGWRGFTVLDHSIVASSSPPLQIVLAGWMVRDKTFGGIPLTGYREAKLIIYSSKSNELQVNEYFLTIPPMVVERDKLAVNPGKNTIDLRSYSGIVSFKFTKPLSDEEAVVIDLK